MSELALFGGKGVVAASEWVSWPIVSDDERKAVLEVLDRGILSGLHAPTTRAFEAEFAAAVGAKHALLTHCGTSALQLAVAAENIGVGDEVIVPAYSFIATAFAVLLQGGVPVFVDTDDRGLLDPALVEAAISPRTRAIMPVHVHGCPADLDELGAIAKKHGLALLEDAAQAHLATYRGKPVGALYRSGGFSLQSSKNLSAGEGGVFVTNDDDLALWANRVRTFGQDVVPADRDHYSLTRPLDGHRGMMSLRLGSMYRGNEMMAAFALAALRKLPERTRAAQANAKRLFARLAELPGLVPPPVTADRESVHHKVRIRFDPAAVVGDLPADAAARRTLTLAVRDTLMKALRAEGVEVVLWQDAPMNEHPVFQERRAFGQGKPWTSFPEADQARLQANYARGSYPRTQALLDSSFCLFSQTCPLIAQPASVVDHVADAVAKVWERRGELGAAVAAATA
jgi:perosamine synthetase